MFVVRCANKHYFDFDTYQFCPECARLGMSYNVEKMNVCNNCQQPVLFYDAKRKISCPTCGTESLAYCICGAQVVNFCSECGTRLLGNEPDTESGVEGQYEDVYSFENEQGEPAVSSIPQNEAPSYYNNETESGYNTQYEAVYSYDDEEDDKTASAYEEPYEEDDDEGTVSSYDVPDDYIPDNFGDEENDATESAYEEEVVSDEDEDSSFEEDDEDEDSGDLISEVEKVLDDDEDDATLNYYSYMMRKRQTKEVEASVSEPVVGWLVCVGGEHFGESFNIYSGNNSIGRKPGNRIVLNKDNSVSGEKHAFVVFEPKKSEFFIQPGNSSGLAYINDIVILVPTKLNSYEIIKVGNTELLFVPLCGENFDWNTYISKE
ncbi:MAG: FHA domain-containing protein [Clostridia bacterium]|nr:FHA domain-containing protein [Clostridia bacterium]